MSAQGALKIFHIFDRALIREAGLFRNYQTREFRFFTCDVKLNITHVYKKNTEFSR